MSGDGEGEGERGGVKGGVRARVGAGVRVSCQAKYYYYKPARAHLGRRVEPHLLPHHVTHRVGLAHAQPRRLALGRPCGGGGRGALACPDQARCECGGQGGGGDLVRLGLGNDETRRVGRGR